MRLYWKKKILCFTFCGILCLFYLCACSNFENPNEKFYSNIINGIPVLEPIYSTAKERPLLILQHGLGQKKETLQGIGEYFLSQGFL